MTSARLERRGVLEVSGSEARAFLDRIVTCDVGPVAPGRAAYGALLSPQGKILADFILFSGREDGAFLLDVAAAALPDLAKRLTLYRLRAKIGIADRSADLGIAAGWGEAPPPDALAGAADPRLAALGWRAIVRREPAAEGEGDDGAYEAHRIALGIPEGGHDFAFGDAFPHEAVMDQLGGVAFDKGCYVGQEVVSRMQHRGTARTRVVPVRFAGEAPPSGSEVRGGDRVVGRTASVAGQAGLAMLRLDRAEDALASGSRLEAGGVGLEVERREWIGFPLPRRPDGHAA